MQVVLIVFEEGEDLPAALQPAARGQSKHARYGPRFARASARASTREPAAALQPGGGTIGAHGMGRRFYSFIYIAALRQGVCASYNA